MCDLAINSKEIHQLDNLYSLNDLHKSAGEEAKHQPARFLRLKQTQELIKEIEHSPDMGSAKKVKNGGKDRGTYVCEELVYAYGMWISAKIHLTIIRAFKQIQKQKQKLYDKEQKAIPSGTEQQLLITLKNGVTIKSEPFKPTLPILKKLIKEQNARWAIISAKDKEMYLRAENIVMDFYHSWLLPPTMSEQQQIEYMRSLRDRTINYQRDLTN